MSLKLIAYNNMLMKMSQNRKVIIIGAFVIILFGGAYIGFTAYGSGKLRVSVTDPPKEWGKASDVYIRIHQSNGA